MATNASDIQITASLIDDYLMTMDAPVGPNPAGRFVAVQDPTMATPTTALLSVDSCGNMVQFYPDASSHSGWNMAAVPVSAPTGASGGIARLAAYAQSGTTNALAYFPLEGGSGNAATWMQSTAPGTWNQAALTHDSANALGYTYQTDYYIDGAGNQYLYGVTGSMSGGAFFLVWFNQQAGAWDVLYEQFLNQFTPALSAGAAFRLMPGADGGINVLWIDGGVIYWQPATITDPGTENADFSWAGDVASFDPDFGPLTISEIIPLPGGAGQNNLLIIDGAQTLYLVQGYDQESPALTALTGATDGSQPAGALSAAVGVDATGNLILLLAETATQALWILRQNGVDGVVPVFDPWVPLGNTVGAVAAPPAMAGGPELFLVDLSLDAYHMSQNLTDLVWATQKIAAPTPSGTTPTNIAGTVTNLTVVDANQAPIAGASISVASDQPVTIVLAGVSYPVAPGAPAQIQADPTGQASLVVETTTLSPPPLTFTVTNQDGTTAQRASQGDQVQVKPGETPLPVSPASVASRLAGDDPNQPLTATTLQNAGLISSSYPDSSGAVSAIAAAGQWMLQNGPGDINALSLDHVAVRHWRIEFPPDGSPRFRRLSESEASAYVRNAQPAELGSFFSKIFGDVANYFKNAWKELTSITVTIGDELKIIFNDAESFVVNTVRQAGQALEAVFTRIVQGLVDAYDAIKNVVAWLKQLFEWGDILNTHRVIKAMVNSGLDELISSIAAAEQKVEDKFGTVKDKIKAKFGNLESIFADQTFQAFANAAGASPIGGSGNVLTGQPASTAYSQNGPRANYVQNHVKTYYTGSGGGGSGSTGNIPSLVQNNWTGDTFNQNTQTVRDFLTSNVSDPHQFFDLVIIGLLQAAEDLVIFLLDAVEDIILAALEVLQAAIEGLQTAWNKPIDIPIISWLYKYVITGTEQNPGDDLTALDALALLLAVPSTILYKILIGNGSAPFTSADADNIEQNGLPWPQFGQWPPAAAGPAAPAGSAAAARREALLETSSTLPMLMGVLAGVASFFGTFITAGADAMAFQEVPDAGLKQFLSWASVVTGFVGQVGGAPWDIFANGPASAADDWTVVLWACAGVPLIADTIFTFATGGLARYTDDLGPVLDTGMGWAMVGVAIVTIFEQAGDKPPYTGWDQANSIVPQIGRAFKFLILTKDDPEAAAIALPVLVTIDLVLGIGSTVTQIGDAIEG